MEKGARLRLIDSLRTIAVLSMIIYQFICSLIKKQKETPKFLYFKIPVFEFIGRHAPIIYLAHQPVLYALTQLIIKIQGE